ncbi:uncharacterized protein TRUGW13939_10545 [Talaromyces rugulosus]|uniref:catalase n=1 Tax=Talaromyces rugulosus TaxID=121627 RepID=A0A7H8RCY9_TALRU|nr:uncharacterized protein TRUGW13939_10545 [Talaromyces rugulosus]QKX63375.1 hypothetical protein TRUGW13939_10545 [Talaromyces rugulosus]
MSLSSGVNIANEGEGFFTTPGRTASGKLQRTISPSFSDLWSQPRLFFNSLVPTEQQFLINAIRFETANVKSTVVRNNIVIQLNRISNDVAKRVARALNVEEPQPDPTYYHDNKTTDVGVFGTKLKRLDGLKIGVLASVAERSSIDEANALRSSFASDDVDVIVVAERFEAGVDQTYSASDAINFDAIIVADGADDRDGWWEKREDGRMGSGNWKVPQESGGPRPTVST